MGYIRELYKKKDGITLIALVVTVVVILVIASVSFNVLFGNNGILMMAERGKKITRIKGIYDQLIYKEKNEDIEKQELETIEKSDPTLSTSQFASGTGIETEPYIIETPSELVYLASQVNNGNTFQGKYIKITRQLNFDPDKEFVPIGFNGKSFKGILYADEMIEITGININKKEHEKIGLIGYLDGGKVKNIKVKGNIIGKNDVGGIAGYIKNSVIENCENNANVEGTYVTESTVNEGLRIGGIVGNIESGNIKNCINYGNVIGKNNNKTKKGKCVGGIVGFINNTTTKVTIENCINLGNITAEYQQVGGIVGAKYGSKATLIKNCINYGKVIANNKVQVSGAMKSGCAGGIIGAISDNITGTEVIDCINDGNVYSNYSSSVGDILGYKESGKQYNLQNCENFAEIIIGPIE